MADAKVRKTEDGRVCGTIKVVNRLTKVEEKELIKLEELYSNIPPNKMKLLEGLIQEAARLRAQLNDLWIRISEEGLLDEEGNETTASKMFTAKDKSYQTIIKQLNAELPPEERKESRLSALLSDFDDED